MTAYKDSYGYKSRKRDRAEKRRVLRKQMRERQKEVKEEREFKQIELGEKEEEK